MKTFADHMSYLETLGKQHKKIESVVRGDYEQIMNIANTELSLPCLWIETPDCRLQGDADHYYAAYEGNIVILLNADANDLDDRMYKMHQAQQIAIEIQARLAIDQRPSRFTLDNSALISLPPLEVDNLIGWRMSYTIYYDEDGLCHIPSQWSANNIITPSFSVDRTDADSIELTAEIENLDPSITHKWKYDIDNGAIEGNSALEILTLSEVGKVVYIQLLDSAENVLASAYIDKKVYNTLSVPYDYNPLKN